MEPNCGDCLEKAMMLADENVKIPSLEDVMGDANGPSMGGVHGISGSQNDPNRS